ncbi:MAG: hypothetical protein COX48_05345 [bacterium (Candidatus Stahlbacteria) CG23_combo_of_CG06-09_8_20_14_all_34_7]|nr:MAG: hypothetical protein COX48_05345 [bacterium (Candidatus Stahlbacteria) CG23_combo_of_CG06-09_8_20_14_all_34_7]
MKKKFKGKKITWKNVLVLILIAVFGLLFFQPRVGLLSLSLKIIQKKKIERSIEELQVKMVLQRHKIELLKNNEDYIEKMIREKTNMIKTDEKIIKR